MPEQQSESKSSVKVNLTAKGEAQVEVKVYEGEGEYVAETPTRPPSGANAGEIIPANFVILNASATGKVAVERLVETVNSLERQRIKVVGRELPDISIDQGNEANPDAIRRS